MSETTRIMTKANETMAHNSQERLDIIRKVATGEISKDRAQELLDAQEERNQELLWEIDERIEKVEGELEGLDKPLGGIDSSNWTIWLILTSLAVCGSFAVWILIFSMR